MSDKSKQQNAHEELDNFVLARKEYFFTLEDPETKKKRKCFLREPTGLGRDAYLNGLSQRTKYSGDGKPVGIKDFKGVQASLLTKMMGDCETGELFDENYIQSLPSSVVTQLHEKAKELAALGADAEAEAKND